MPEDPTILEVSMAMAMGEEPLDDAVDPETLEAVRTTLTTWVINEFIEEQQKDKQDDEEDSDEILRNLIENAVACAYVFARLQSDAPNQPTEPHHVLTAQIVEALLANGTATLSITVE